MPNSDRSPTHADKMDLALIPCNFESRIPEEELWHTSDSEGKRESEPDTKSLFQKECVNLSASLDRYLRSSKTRAR